MLDQEGDEQDLREIFGKKYVRTFFVEFQRGMESGEEASFSLERLYSFW